MSYTPPRYEVIRASVEASWKLKFGANADTSSDTVDGLIVDLLALALSKNYQALAQLDSQHFLSTASGPSVDALLAPMFGITRLPASGSTCEVVLYGDTGTIISTGSLASTYDTGTQFELDVARTIAPSVYCILVFPPIETPTIIGVTIGAVATPVSVAAMTALEVAEEVAQQITLSNSNVVIASVVGVQPDGQAIVHVTMTSTWSFSVTDGEAYEVSVGSVTATSTGPQVAAAGTLTRTVDSIDGWVGLVNLVDATPGRNEETDAAYKARHALAFQGIGFATVRGLAGSLAALDGVSSVRVYVNPGSTTDADGRPPHSFEAVVQGGDSEEIAENIWLNHTTGTQSYGSTTYIITDAQGLVATDISVQFTRPTVQYIHVRLTITRGEGFPALALTDAQALLSQEIETWGNALGIGRDVYAPAVSGIVTDAFDGVSNVLVEMDATLGAFDSPIYASGNLSIGVRDLPVFAATRVLVVFA